MAVRYTQNLSVTCLTSTEADDFDEHKRWQKKTMKARILIGVLTAICSILIVILIVTYESGHKYSTCTEQKNERAVSNDIIKFVHFSDIHYDPFYDKTIPQRSFCRKQISNSTAKYTAQYGRIGCDSPIDLVQNSLDAIQNVSKMEDVSFILLTGDLSGHGMWTSYAGPHRVLDNIAQVSNRTHARFPNIPIFPVVGNNDLPGHYVLPNSSDWYKELLTSWAPLILCSSCPNDVKKPTTLVVLEESFLEGGYYNASIAGGKIVLLVLNSLYWSVAVDHNAEIFQKAVQQLTWLEYQLEIAAMQGQKVILVGHIPAGIDTYDGKSYWFSNYTSRYVSLVAEKYSSLVTAQFFAHSHKDDFRLQMSMTETEDTQQGAKKAFVLLAPAISPVYHNNPAFRVVSLDTDQLALLDYTQYYMDLVMATEFASPIWQLDYTFSQKYPSQSELLDADRINELNEQLINQTSNKVWKGYAFSRETNYQPEPYSRFQLYCGMRFVHKEDFQRCIEEYNVPGG